MTRQKPGSSSTPSSSQSSPKGRKDDRFLSRERERIEERGRSPQGNRDFRNRARRGGKQAEGEKKGEQKNVPRSTPQPPTGNAAAQPCIFLRAGREKSLLRRHPWVFSGAVERVDGAPANGDTLAVRDARCGRGFPCMGGV